jgi:2-dehydropantoate 2-reductase
MRFTVVGAGAIGGTVGAYLARDGNTVTFVDADQPHVRSMLEHGLQIRGYRETFTVTVDAEVPTDGRHELGTVLLCTKSQHTAAAARWVAPSLAADEAVVSLQNGLCERVIAHYVGAERVIGALVNFSADLIGPATVHFAGPGAFVLGELDGVATPRLAALVETLQCFGPVQATNNIYGFLWAKLAYANMLFATALVDEPIADVIERFPSLMVELVREMCEVANTEGVSLERFDDFDPAVFYPRADVSPGVTKQSLGTLIERRRSDPKNKTGIWRDLAVHHRKTEVDEQLGIAVSIGCARGLAMPLTHTLIRMIHEIEAEERGMSWSNLEALASECSTESAPLRRHEQP